MSTTTTYAAAGTLRLTRRGRVVVLTLALLVVLAVGVLLAGGSAATLEAGTPEPSRVVMVGSGETLWDIAGEAAGDGDVRVMLERIKDLNRLDTVVVTAGQKLRVPTTG